MTVTEKNHRLMFTQAFLCAVALFISANVGVAALAQTTPEPPVSSSPVPSLASYVVVTKYEKLAFSDPSKITLHTWYMQSEGMKSVEVRAWYIAGGKALLRDQRILFWDQNKQAGTWRLALVEQKGANKNLLPSFGISSIFDSNDPTATAIGLANDEARAPVKLPSPFFIFFPVTNTKSPGFQPDQPYIPYAEQTQKNRGEITLGAAFDLLADNEKKPVEALTKLSQKPGTAFFVLTLEWKTAKSFPKN